KVDAVTRKPKLNIDTALDDHHLLVVGARLSGGEVSSTLSSLLVNQLRQRLYERFGERRRPVLLVIDEAAQIANRVDIAQLMEVARSAGVGVVVAIQDAAKLRDENDRSSILSNASAFAILPGASPLSIDAFSKRLGQRFERTHSVTTGGSGDHWSGPQRTLGMESVPVMREREIMQNPFGSRPATVQVNAGELGITTKPLLVDLFRPEDQ
ncbi:MAG: TraG/TraD/VirD4 family protein, partial [Actinomycetota bacterium]|nr:TraG/TraD/VirD4 family protein [Actinomycetota bacterium]